MGTSIYIEHMNTHTDELGRFVTTLTQEICTNLNTYEEKIFKDTLCQIDEQVGCIEYHDDNYSHIECSGYGVQKAIDTVNSVASYKILVPVTSIKENKTYKIEFLN